MGLRHLLNSMTSVTDVKMEYVPCGATCTRCGNGECSDNCGHSDTTGHHSRSGEKRCGHTWGAVAKGWGV